MQSEARAHSLDAKHPIEQDEKTDEKRTSPTLDAVKALGIVLLGFLLSVVAIAILALFVVNMTAASLLTLIVLCAAIAPAYFYWRQYRNRS